MLDYEEALQIANDYIEENGVGCRPCGPRVSDDDWIFFLYPYGVTGNYDSTACLFIDRRSKAVVEGGFYSFPDRFKKAKDYSVQ